MDINQIYVKLESIIQQAIGLPNKYIILSHQNAPMPAIKDFATITPISIVDKGSHKRTLTPNGTTSTDNFTEKSGSKYLKVTVMLQFYGSSSSIHASKLLAMTCSSWWCRTMRKNGMGFINADPITLPAWLVNQSNVQRAAMNLQFYIEDYVTTTVNALDVDSIKINGQIDLPKTNFIINNKTPKII